MVEKKWVILTSGLAAVAALVLLTTREETTDDPRLGQPIAPAASGTALAADHIVLKGSTSSLTLVKTPDGAWRIGDDKGFPADPAKVIRLFDDLARDKYQTIVTEKEEGFKELGLDSPTTLTVQAGGKDVFALMLGDTRRGGGQFAALVGEKKAYLLSRPLTVYADADQWETKTLVKVDKDQIKSLTFRPAAAAHKKPVTLSREKKEDTLTPTDLTAPEKAKGESGGFASFLDPFTFASRLDASNEGAKAALADANVVEAKTFDGRSYEIRCGSSGEKDKKKWFAAVKAADANDPVGALMNGNAFEVSAYVGERCAKGREDLVEGGSPAKG